MRRISAYKRGIISAAGAGMFAGGSNAAASLGLTQRTGQLQVARLESLGILRESTGRLRDRVFVAQAIINTIREERGQSLFLVAASGKLRV